MFAEKQRAFTLVELLVVISVIGLLMAILMPSLSKARSQARSMVCRSNLRQLFFANTGYSTEHNGYYVPGAPDITEYKGGNHRWHGVRSNPDEAFDPLKGPLAGYLADGEVKECPRRVDFFKGQEWEESFEKGCGGYGYNNVYIGSRQWQGREFSSFEEMRRAGWETTRSDEVGRPSETLMFADTAMSKQGATLIEYSFAEPPFYVYKGEPVTGSYLSASIHFRHRGMANIGWADGHIDSREMAKFDGENVYGVNSADVQLGWFEPLDNSLFDLK